MITADEIQWASVADKPQFERWLIEGLVMRTGCSSKTAIATVKQYRESLIFKGRTSEFRKHIEKYLPHRNGTLTNDAVESQESSH